MECNGYIESQAVYAIQKVYECHSKKQILCIKSKIKLLNMQDLRFISIQLLWSMTTWSLSSSVYVKRSKSLIANFLVNNFNFTQNIRTI